MERETFSSPEIAAVLNASFIPIKVDRECRPDIDEIYMNYVTSTTGSGGWPLNVFLTPDLQPIFGGTYWPGPSSRSTSGRRSSGADAESPLTFADVLAKMKLVWSTQRDRCIQAAGDITNQLRDFAAEGTHQQSPLTDSSEDEPLELDLLDDALDHFIERYDSQYGGFVPSTPNGPKFPNPPNLTFLLRLGAAIAYPSTHTRFGFPAPVPGILGKPSCAEAATIALHTLLSISRSGLRDHLGFGFHRYSVTPDWNLPHFEKMLPDNAQLLSCYCNAWALSKDPEILGTIYNLVEYFTNPDSPIVAASGGWYASEDADSRPSKSDPSADRGEGAYYVWTLKELQSILGERDAGILARHFGVKGGGNVPAKHDLHDEFLTQNVLRIEATPSVLAKEFGLLEEEIVRVIKAGRTKLAEYREKERERPSVDTKIIASWNGLAISALARAANTLASIDKERSQRCYAAAEKAAAFIREMMYDKATGRLGRMYTSEAPVLLESNTAFIDDYAHLTYAAISLYDLTFSHVYLDWALQLQDYTIQNFASDTGGFYQAPTTPSDAEAHQRIIRLKQGSDTSLPSPNGLVVTNLLYLGAYLDSTVPSLTAGPYTRHPTALAYASRAHDTLSAFAIEATQHPFLFPGLLASLVMEEVGVKALVVPEAAPEKQIRRLRGWGRSVVRGSFDKVMICVRAEGAIGGAAGLCREMRESDLNDVDTE